MRVMICLSNQTIELHFYEPMQVFTALAEVWLTLAHAIAASVTALQSRPEGSWAREDSAFQRWCDRRSTITTRRSFACGSPSATAFRYQIAAVA